MLQSSIMGRAIRQQLLHVDVEPIRQHGLGKHHRVDDTPYGGGPGQLLRVDVVVNALRAALARGGHSAFVCHTHSLPKHSDFPQASESKRGHGPPHSERKKCIVLVDAAGTPFTHTTAKRWAELDHLVFVCGRYEGIDSRIHHYVDETVSIGDYVLTGGELPALVMLDAVLRYVPGVLGNPLSSSHDSFEDGLLEHSQYTVPTEFEGHHVPELLRGGHHARIAKVQHAERLFRTKLMRPLRGFAAEACESDETLREAKRMASRAPCKVLDPEKKRCEEKNKGAQPPPWLRHVPG